MFIFNKKGTRTTNLIDILIVNFEHISNLFSSVCSVDFEDLLNSWKLPPIGVHKTFSSNAKWFLKKT